LVDLSSFLSLSEKRPSCAADTPRKPLPDIPARKERALTRQLKFSHALPAVHPFFTK
jgi:hypothetical protein